mgnify:CR=1 FL=1
MSLAFPNPCSHCGLCCMAKVCPVGVELMRVTPQGPCPALEWEGDTSRCGLIAHPERHLPAATLRWLNLAALPQALGSGAGCCISARVLTPDGQRDFAALSAETKIRYVRLLRGR